MTAKEYRDKESITDANFWNGDEIDFDAICEFADDYHKSELKLLGIANVSGSLPVYATTFDDKGELEHQRFNTEYAGEIITELSKKVNEFETFIDSFNENYR